ncbi:ATP-grasp domain-containing protein [Streptomyces sp. NPDC002466]|uniref:ATP-grasp domain-containing protein n=1 Tax=unclassified Streptomyces TaxID=2593676 RepID=UPI0035E2B8C1
MAHVVFVDSGPASLAAFEVAKGLGHHVTFVEPLDVSTLRLTATSRDRVAAALEHVDRTFTVDRLAEDLDGRMRLIHEELPVDAVITTSELAVLPTARAAESIGVETTPEHRLARVVEKDLCRDLLVRAGIRSPRHATVTDAGEARTAAREIGFPLVVKPSRGTAKEGAAIIRAQDGLDAYFDGRAASRAARDATLDTLMGTRLVMETYLEGVLYSAEIVAGGGDIRVMMITRRERATHNELFEVAAVMPSGLPQERAADVEDYMRAVFGELRLTVGVYHVEFIMTADGPTLVEINPRMMGGMSPFVFRHVTGVDPFRVLVAEHLGERPELPGPPFDRAGIVVAFGSVEGGVLPADVERRVEALVDEYRPLRHSLNVRGGDRVPRLTGNYSVLGYFCLGARTTEEARYLGRALISDMSDALGQRLATYD